MESATHQKVIRATRKTADVECLSCGTIQTVERDEDGAAIDQSPCHDDSCTRRLCEHCPQFSCTSCGLAHCTSHRVRIGTEAFCATCTRLYAAEAVAEYRELVEEVAA